MIFEKAGNLPAFFLLCGFQDSRLWAFSRAGTARARRSREEDSGGELWKVLNRVQENLVKGGICYRTQKGRHMTSRGITGATPLIQMNERLWALAEEYL